MRMDRPEVDEISRTWAWGKWVPETRTARRGSAWIKYKAGGGGGVTIALTGQLPSGKNQVQQLWRNGKVWRYPNATFKTWRDRAAREVLMQARPAVPLSAPIRLTCDYWPGDSIVRDVSG